jgi:hypothetical protein
MRLGEVDIQYLEVTTRALMVITLIIQHLDNFPWEAALSKLVLKFFRNSQKLQALQIKKVAQVPLFNGMPPLIWLN